LFGAVGGVIIYNGYQVYNEIDAYMAGRKVPNAGWSGAWNVISGSAQAAAAGCAFGSAVAAGAGAGAEGLTQVALENGVSTAPNGAVF
jgi:hypothetical protein